MLSVSFEPFEVNNPLLFIAELNNAVGVFVLVVKRPVFGVKLRFESIVLAVDIG